MPRNSRPRPSGQQQKTWDRSQQRKRPTRYGRNEERRLSVRGELRDSPDIRKIARVVISMAMAQAEADAELEEQRRQAPEAEEQPEPSSE